MSKEEKKAHKAAKQQAKSAKTETKAQEKLSAMQVWERELGERVCLCMFVHTNVVVVI